MWEISRRQLIWRLICKPVRYRTVDQADHSHHIATTYSCQRASVSHQKLTKADTNLQNFQDITEHWFHANDLIHFLSRIIGLSSKSLISVISSGIGPCVRSIKGHSDLIFVSVNDARCHDRIPQNLTWQLSFFISIEKKSRQQLAIENASRLVYQILQSAGK